MLYREVVDEEVEAEEVGVEEVEIEAVGDVQVRTLYRRAPRKKNCQLKRTGSRVWQSERS